MINKVELVISILDQYTIESDYIEVDKSLFAEALVNAKGKVSKYLKISESKLTKLVSRLFPDRPKGKILNFVLSLDGYKHCTNCGNYLSVEYFRLNKSNVDGLNSFCMTCHMDTTAKTQPFRQAKYNSNKLKATPPWANLDKIKEIYNKCPNGCHVDHIYPLNGINSCGLHVENNLQYLPALENVKKGNKLPTL